MVGTKCSHEDVEPDELRALAVRLSRSALVLDAKDEKVLKCLAETILRYSEAKWAELTRCAVANGSPMLYCYGSDGWSRIISGNKVVRHPDGIVKRAGRLRAEYLLEKEILKTIGVDGRIHMVMNFAAPRPMMHGKTGWNIFQAAVERRAMLRFDAPGNIITHFFVQDGLHADQFGRYMAARHALFYQHLEEVNGSEDALIAEKDIQLSWRCTLHVASSAIHWGMKPYVPTPTTLDDIHIAIKSLINSSLSLFEVVEPFVLAHVQFCRESSAEIASYVVTVWKWLGVPDKMIDEVVEMDFLWNPATKKLEVSKGMLQFPDRHTRVVNVLMYFLRWKDFSETRWAGVVRSSQMVIASLLIGILLLPL